MSKSPSSTDLPSLSLEDALASLQSIVETLETGNLPLADTLARFEEGSRLAELCQKLIEHAELRISVVTDDADGDDDEFYDEEPANVPF